MGRRVGEFRAADFKTSWGLGLGSVGLQSFRVCGVGLSGLAENLKIAMACPVLIRSWGDSLEFWSKVEAGDAVRISN